LFTTNGNWSLKQEDVNWTTLSKFTRTVTQYGVTPDGQWCAVSGGHCSCYGWEEMNAGDVVFYPSLKVLLEADKSASIILTHQEILKEVLPFLNFSLE
jgi:hypothetical protein